MPHSPRPRRGCRMTPEEKIEALRKLFDNIDGNIEELKQGAWWDGFYWTRQKVRDIIDPPKPKWRELVDEAAAAANRHWLQEPLASTLYHLHLAAAYERAEPYEHLANVIAICEAQVGDGWRADPDRANFGNDPKTVMWLLDSLVRYFKPANYRITGNRAAYWLRDLCDGGAE